MIKVSFYKIQNSQLSSLPIREGQVIYVTDSKRLYLDSAQNNRIELASYNLVQDATNNHILTFIRPDGTSSSYTIPDHIYTATNHIEIDENNVISLDDETLDLLYGDSLLTINSENGIVILENSLEDNLVGLGIDATETKQETTTGKNLLQIIPSSGTINGITYTIGVNEITLNGTASANTAIYLANNISETFSAGTYTFSKEVLSGTKTDGTFNLIAGSNSFYGDLRGNSYTTELENELTATYISLYIRNGVVFTNYKVRFQLESGSSKTDWEPYTGGNPSPSPDYPQDVETMVGIRNLFDKDNVTFYSAYISADNNWLFANDSKTLRIPIEAQKTYTLSIQNQNENIFRVAWTNSENVPIGQTVVAVYDTIRQTNNITPITITTGINAKYLVVQFGSSQSATSIQTLMVTEGIKAKPYVPYGTNYMVLDEAGKNLFDYTKHSALALDSNGRITTTHYYTADNLVTYKLKPNTQYTFSFRNADMEYSNHLLSVAINDTWVQTKSGKYTVTTDENGEFTMKIGASAYSEVGNASAYIQLEQGSTATSYEPYKGKQYPISLANQELLNKNDYVDKIIIDEKTEQRYIEKVWGKVVLDGNENWTLAASNRFYIKTIINYAISNNIPISTHYKGISNVTGAGDAKLITQDKIIAFINVSGDTTPRFYIKDTQFNNVDDVKTFLQTQYNNGTPVEVYYVLAEPQLVPIDNPNIKLLNGINYIANSEDADMKIEYYNKSINGIYDELSNRINNIDYIDRNEIGEPNGVAELDENGILLSSQMPAYVDDVLEYANRAAFPATGESGKIYVALDTNLTYRWSGTTYVEISPSLALGETSSTAYRGDRGAAAYKHAVTNKGSQFLNNMYKFATNAEGHVISATAITKSDITGLGIPGTASTGIEIEGTDIQLEDEAYNTLYGDSINETEDSSYLTIDMPMENKISELEIHKETTQETTTGKNKLDNTNLLYNYSNVSSDKNSLETISTGIKYTTTSSGTPTIAFKSIDLTNYVGKTIRMKSTFGTNGEIRLGLTNEEVSSREVKVIGRVSDEAITFQVPSDLGDNKYLIYYLAIVNGNSSVDFTDLIITIDNDDMTYEPYTGGIASPNPDYPQDVETIVGYRNLFDKSTAVIGKNWNGNTMVYSIASDYIEVEENKEYLLSIADMPNYSSATIVCLDSNKESILPALTTNPFITTANAKYIKLSIRSATTHTWTQEELDNAKIMLTEGTQALPYVPYGTNYMVFNKVGKNLCDIANVTKTAAYGTYSYNNGVITITPTSTSAACRLQFMIPKSIFKLGKTYTLSCIGANKVAIGYAKNISDTSNYAYFGTNTNGSVLSFTYTTIPNDYIGFYLYNKDATENINWTITNIQVEEGSIVTSYEPYQHKQYLIPLANQELLSKGDYVDKIIVDESTGQSYIEKVFGKKYFKDLNIIYASTNSYFYCELNDMYIESSANVMFKGFSNIYKPTTSVNNAGWASKPNYTIGVRPTTNILCFKDNDYTDVTSFKAARGGNYFYYPLSTPELIPIDNPNIKLLNGVNHLSNSENANMKIKYDNKSINNLYDIVSNHAITNKGNEFESNIYKFATNAEGHVTEAEAITASDGIVINDTNIQLADDANNIIYGDSYNTYTGTNIQLESPMECDVNKLEIDAIETKQETIIGKNLFNGNAVTTTATGNWGVSFVNDVLTIEHKNTYSTGTPTIDLGTLASGTYVISGTFTEAIRLYKNGALDTSLVSGNTFNCNGTDDISLSFYFPTAETKTYKNIQIEQGLTATDYEPYTGGQASPSPEFPQDVETMVGYENLLPNYRNESQTHNGIKYEVNDNGSVKVSGSATAYSRLIDTQSFLLKAGTYYLYNSFTTITGVYTELRDTNGNTIINTNSRTNFTINQDTNIIYRIYVVDGTQNVNATVYPMIVKEKELLNFYLPYGTNYMVLDDVGKNKFTTDYTELAPIRILDKEKNNFKLLSSWARDFVLNNNLLLMLKPNTTYTISCQFKILSRPSSFSSSNQNRILSLYKSPELIDIVATDLKNTAPLDTWINYTNTITTPDDLTNWKILYYDYKDSSNNTTGEIDINEFQIEEGSTATNFKEYQHKQYPISLANQELLNKNDYVDKIIVDEKTGQSYIEKRWTKDIFDSSEGWSSTEAYEGYYRFLLRDNYIHPSNDALCNRLINRGSTAHGGYEYIYYQANSTSVYIQLLQSRLTDGTTTSFNTFLANNNVIAYHPLAEPQLIPIDNPNIKLLNGVNNITNSEKANMKIISNNNSIKNIYELIGDVSGLLDTINGEEV